MYTVVTHEFSQLGVVSWNLCTENDSWLQADDDDVTLRLHSQRSGIGTWWSRHADDGLTVWWGVR